MYVCSFLVTGPQPKAALSYKHTLFADYLARNTNHEVTYLAKRAPEPRECYSYEIRKIDGLWPQHYGMFGDSRSLLRTLAQLKPDLIVQRVASAYTGIAAIYARRNGAKLLWHVSSDRDVSDRPHLPVGALGQFIDTLLFKYGVRNADAVVTQTRQQARILEENYGRRPRAVVPNFSIAPPRSWKKSDQFTVLWIANLKPIKQPQHFVQLAQDLANHDIAFKVPSVGRATGSGADQYLSSYRGATILSTWGSWS